MKKSSGTKISFCLNVFTLFYPIINDIIKKYSLFFLFFTKFLEFRPKRFLKKSQEYIFWRSLIKISLVKTPPVSFPVFSCHTVTVKHNHTCAPFESGITFVHNLLRGRRKHCSECHRQSLGLERKQRQSRASRLVSDRGKRGRGDEQAEKRLR